jgi:signal transduction histidine kinase
MQPIEVYAFVGACVHGTLCLLHGLVWRAQRLPWAACFAGAFALNAFVYAFDAQLRPEFGRPDPASVVLIAVSMVLMTEGFIGCHGLSPHAARLPRVATGCVLLFGAVLAGLQLLTRPAAFGLFSACLVVHAGIAFAAMRREPRSGHAVVVGVLMLYPLLVGAAVLGAFELVMLRYVVIGPMAITGAAVLTTGLLRAQRQAHEEVARRERVEHDLQLLNESLERRVAQRTAELHEVVDGLESFNRSVSHDLRGPLGGIAGLSRLAVDALQAGNAAAARQMVEAIGRQADASAQLVGDLLMLARVGDAELAPQRVDLQRLVSETVDAMRQADPDGAQVPVTVQAMPVVDADPGLLRQVVVNLVGNAVKFSQGKATPQVEVGTLERNGEQIVYVRDNGVGFDPAAAAHLFQPFHRLHGARYQGHGVGLSIVKRAVERHGGRVWAQSAPNAGATFYFSLGSR